MQLQFIKHSGSEFDVVIMCVPKVAPMLLTRNLLYTGITRAKSKCIVIGDKLRVLKAINTRIKSKNLTLNRRLRKILVK